MWVLGPTWLSALIRTLLKPNFNHVNIILWQCDCHLLVSRPGDKKKRRLQWDASSVYLLTPEHLVEVICKTLYWVKLTWMAWVASKDWHKHIFFFVYSLVVYIHTFNLIFSRDLLFTWHVSTIFRLIWCFSVLLIPVWIGGVGDLYFSMLCLSALSVHVVCRVRTDLLSYIFQIILRTSWNKVYWSMHIVYVFILFALISVRKIAKDICMNVQCVYASQ